VQRSERSRKRRPIFPWLGVSALLLMLLAALLGWRALQQDRADGVRSEAALRLSAQVIDTQQQALAQRRTIAQLTADAQRLGLQSAQTQSSLRAAMTSSTRLGTAINSTREQATDLPARERLLALRNTLDSLSQHLASALEPSAATGAIQRDEWLETIERRMALLDGGLETALAAVARHPANVAAELRWRGLEMQVAIVGCSVGALLLSFVCGVVAWRTIQRNEKRTGELEHLATEDGLTGILNRRSLDEALPLEMSRAQRMGYPLTVAMMDMDHFKRYNDTRGHLAGDTLLRGATQNWRKVLRPTDILARYGGEEFTLILPTCATREAHHLIERLRELVPDHQTFSAGIAAWDGKCGPAELLQQADEALLRAKRHGRNRTELSSHTERLIRHSKLRTKTARA
jgi:diguanylate cyclase (GGDEF)-like protein